MEPNMFIGVVLAICFMGCATFIIAKIIDRRCKHEWETESQIPVYPGNSMDDIPVKWCYVLRCKHCGKIDKIDI